MQYTPRGHNLRKLDHQQGLCGMLGVCLITVIAESSTKVFRLGSMLYICKVLSCDTPSSEAGPFDMIIKPFQVI